VVLICCDVGVFWIHCDSGVVICVFDFSLALSRPWVVLLFCED